MDQIIEKSENCFCDLIVVTMRESQDYPSNKDNNQGYDPDTINQVNPSKWKFPSATFSRFFSIFTRCLASFSKAVSDSRVVS